jgi:hypothetical protein
MSAPAHSSQIYLCGGLSAFAPLWFLPADGAHSSLGTLAVVAGAATTLSVLPHVIQRALAVAANRRSGSILDVEHIAILMRKIVRSS